MADTANGAVNALKASKVSYALRSSFAVCTEPPLVLPAFVIALIMLTTA